MLSAAALSAPVLMWQDDFLATKPHDHCHHSYAGHLHLQQQPRPLAVGRSLSLPFDPPAADSFPEDVLLVVSPLTISSSRMSIT